MHLMVVVLGGASAGLATAMIVHSFFSQGEIDVGLGNGSAAGLRTFPRASPRPTA